MGREDLSNVTGGVPRRLDEGVGRSRGIGEAGLVHDRHLGRARDHGPDGVEGGGAGEGIGTTGARNDAARFHGVVVGLEDVLERHLRPAVPKSASSRRA